MNYYFDNSGNRIGDEIQMTALLKYLRQKYPDKKFYYRDGNKLSQKFFPEGLVEWCSNQPPDTEWMHTGNLWTSRNVLVRKGIYTELNRAWAPQDDTVAFFPLLSPEYNLNRKMGIDLVKSIYETTEKITVYADPGKPHDMQLLRESNIPYVALTSIEEVIEVICRSAYYIGGDTGFTHMAGAAGHQKVWAIYGDSDHDKRAFRHDQEFFANHHHEPDALEDWNYWCSLPCCNPEHLQVSVMSNNALKSGVVKETLESRKGAVEMTHK